jgi:uncharacterized protein YkwD
VSKAAAAIVAACLAFLAFPAAGAAADFAKTSRKAGCAHADANPATTKLRKLRRATWCLLNKERASRGLARLERNRALHRAAHRYSRAMVKRRFFAHTSPRGMTMVDRILRGGFTRRSSRWAMGENIAWGTGQLATPRQIMIGWMNSSGHRFNILQPRFRHVGIGVVRGNPAHGRGGATYTTDFGAH